MSVDYIDKKSDDPPLLLRALRALGSHTRLMVPRFDENVSMVNQKSQSSQPPKDLEEI